MHIILTPVGSSGDVNPFVVIGRELRRRGHDVTLLTAEPFAGMARAADLRFAPTWSTEEYELATNNPALWDSRRGLNYVLKTMAGYQRRSYAALERLYEPHRTMVLGHTLAFFTRVFEEVHGVPAATVHLAPNAFRSDFKQPVLPPARDISNWPRPAKRAFWWLADRFVIDPHLAPVLNAWRAELNLPSISRIFNGWVHSPLRILGLFPDWFGDLQADWPPQLRLTGFVLSDEATAPDIHHGSGRRGSARDLQQFLSDGPPAVVFTPGSANKHAREFFRAAVDATARIGRRALLVTAYDAHLPASLPAHAYHVPYAPFGSLFPKAAAVVHHAGIGTCAQAFAAGVPQLLMPMGFDQPDNAARVARLGVGEVLAPVRFTADRVAAALTRLLTSEDVAVACQRWRDRMDSPAAVGRACDAIQERFDT